MKRIKADKKLVTASILKTYVTQAQFKRTIAQLSKRDDALSRAIVGLEKNMNNRFEQVNDRFVDMENRMNDRFSDMENRMDSRFADLENRMEQGFNRLNNHIDAFMKRTESNDLGIKLLGKQHDDLAKYCTEKIGYPVYGRNL